MRNVFTSLSASSGGGAVEYDSLSDLPGSPTDGEQAVVGGMLLVATGGVWQFQSPQTPRVTVSESSWGNVANSLDFVLLGEAGWEQVDLRRDRLGQSVLGLMRNPKSVK